MESYWRPQQKQAMLTERFLLEFVVFEAKRRDDNHCGNNNHNNEQSGSRVSRLLL